MTCHVLPVANSGLLIALLDVSLHICMFIIMGWKNYYLQIFSISPLCDLLITYQLLKEG